jgi:hypothetical protein
VRQKLGEPGNGMIGDSGEHVFELGERVYSDALTRSHVSLYRDRGAAGLS